MATTAIRIWLGTLRWRVATPVPPGPAVFAFWHRHVPPAAAFFRKWRAAAMVSASRDGQFLADLLADGGLELVRASSSQGASTGARNLLRSLREGRSVVTVWDGPRGPANVPKQGPQWLARSSGKPLFDVLFVPRLALRLGDWSRMELPLPFSVVEVRFQPSAPMRSGGGSPC
ncbi:MAG TPA: DUF374 domain-containing protein [Fibrobacteria bacterium]|nr:DUF374 domain-containing protein [Fibrobacteria bacterium]